MEEGEREILIDVNNVFHLDKVLFIKVMIVKAHGVGLCTANPSQIGLRREEQGLKSKRMLTEWPDREGGFGIMSLGLESDTDQSTGIETYDNVTG